MKKRTLTTLLLTAVLAMLMIGCGTSKATEKEETTKKEETTVKEITPVEATITTASHFGKLESLQVGDYQIKGTEISIHVYEGKECLLAKITDGEKTESFSSSVVVITSDGRNYIYGESVSRSLDRVEYTETEVKELEENVIWTDLPDGVTRCTEGFLSNCTLGEYKNEDGTWTYAIYIDSNEMASVKTEKHLNFLFDDGLAISGDGEVYFIYYASNPYDMKLVKVDMPEKCDTTKYFGIDNCYYDGNDHGFASVVGKSGKEYIIVTRSEELLSRNGIEGTSYYNLAPVEVSADYEVVAVEPENFDTYRIEWWGDSPNFYVNCGIVLNDKYTYEYRIWDTGIKYNYLSNVIPKEELETICGGEVSSYAEVEKIIADMNNIQLPKWEAEHVEEIKAFFKEEAVYQEFGDYSEDTLWGMNEFFAKYGR